MTTSLVISIVVIGMLGIAGIFVTAWWARLLSALPFLLGTLALSQGGIAEPFSSHQMFAFCSVVFGPPQDVQSGKH